MKEQIKCGEEADAFSPLLFWKALFAFASSPHGERIEERG